MNYHVISCLAFCSGFCLGLLYSNWTWKKALDKAFSGEHLDYMANISLKGKYKR